MLFTILFLMIWMAELPMVDGFGRPPPRRKGSEPFFSGPGNEEKYKMVTVPSSDQIADKLKIHRGSHAPRWVWRSTWRVHGYSLPLLHAMDQARSQDLDYSLKCLWCKALSGLDTTSPAYDGGLAYDMLPSGTRRILRLPSWLFPRLIHFNIELRTAYLAQAVQREVEQFGMRKIRLVTLGAGYDARSVRLLTTGEVQEAWELDVAPVVTSKTIMLERLVQRRHQSLPPLKLPNLLVQDLNDIDGYRKAVSNIIGSAENTSEWHTIFLLEGVLIYLDDNVPRSLLNSCSDILRSERVSGSLVFADLFRELANFDVGIAGDFYQSMGWDLLYDSWCVKPGLARHMGIARVEKWRKYF